MSLGLRRLALRYQKYFLFLYSLCLAALTLRGDLVERAGAVTGRYGGVISYSFLFYTLSRYDFWVIGRFGVYDVRVGEGLLFFRAGGPPFDW